MFIEFIRLFFILFHEASVHLPRIGHSTKGFNWYGTERLIRKHLASRGIPTFMSVFPLRTSVLNAKSESSHSTGLTHLSRRPLFPSTSRYYHSRAPKSTAPPRPSTSAASTSPPPPPALHNSHSGADESQDRTALLSGFMGGVRVFFYNLPASERKRLARYLITYPFVRYSSNHDSMTLIPVKPAMSQSETPNAVGFQMFD